MKASKFAVFLSFYCLTIPGIASEVSSEKSTSVTPVVQSIAKIDLNKADAQSLSHAVTGIGPKRAEAIVEHRQRHGEFKSVEGLAEVRGIGKQFVKSHLEDLQKVFMVKDTNQ